ncbi:MAG: hypothetical protein AAFO57_08175, partial [Pseudomonadota bacterium]
MAEAVHSPSLLKRVSLNWALPLAAVSLALFMSLLFLAVSLAAVEFRALGASKAEAERIAQIISSDFAAARMDHVSSTIHTFAPADIVVRTADEVLVASSRGMQDKAL